MTDEETVAADLETMRRATTVPALYRDVQAERRKASAMRWLALAALAGLACSMYFAIDAQLQLSQDADEARCRAVSAEAQAVAAADLVLADRDVRAAETAIFRELVAQAIDGTSISSTRAAELVAGYDDAVVAAGTFEVAYRAATDERRGATAACSR